MTVIPDTIEPYIGWKALYIQSDGKLFSPSWGHQWTPGEKTEASCGYGFVHHAGYAHCRCGFYIADKPRRTLPYMSRNTVLVKVAGWGTTTIADRGCRSQYAYPQAIYAPKRLAKEATLAAQLYGTELHIGANKELKEATKLRSAADIEYDETAHYAIVPLLAAVPFSVAAAIFHNDLSAFIAMGLMGIVFIILTIDFKRFDRAYNEQL